MARKTDKAWLNLIPNPLEIAVLLSVLVIVLATCFTHHSFRDNLVFWGDGLWGLLAFMSQMCLVLLGGFVVAVSHPVKNALKKIVKIPQTTTGICLFTFLVSVVACWLNWGLGLVVSAFFTLEMAKHQEKVSFPFLVSIGYMGFIFWHGGLSGSIPLVVSTPGAFSQNWLGKPIPLNETIFSLFNLSLLLILFCSLALYILLMAKRVEGNQHHSQFIMEKVEESGPVDAVENDWLLWLLSILMISYFMLKIFTQPFVFGLNEVILLLMIAGLVLHRGFNPYIAAVTEGCRKLSPILVQYPLYAGIMGVMTSSGLASLLSQYFVDVSNPNNYSLLMFWSAGVVNLFVPSGGGQWAVQAQVVIEGAKSLGVPLWKVILAVAWGDAWTNLAQPFWALPLLGIVGLGMRDIALHCLGALLVSGSVISLFFLFF